MDGHELEVIRAERDMAILMLARAHRTAMKQNPNIAVVPSEDELHEKTKAYITERAPIDLPRMMAGKTRGEDV